MLTFFNNETTETQSSAFTLVFSKGESIGLNVEGLGSATVQLQRKNPQTGNFIPVLFSGAAAITIDGHYVLEGVPGEYRGSTTGTPTGLYLSAETYNAAKANA